MVIAFFRAVEEDNRILTSHISLYMALLVVASQCGQADSFGVNRRAIMKVSKINGLATYHKCIRDLHDFGYVNYKPSHNSNVQTRVSLVHLG